ncbi:hypothetical protein SynMEDNS5_00844 [Synechococcus sp. MEDNS5]|nr:hypothetical protein SynMEDNS5_00844 [Synechococcus sp. MEDNS5]
MSSDAAHRLRRLAQREEGQVSSSAITRAFSLNQRNKKPPL